MSKFSKLIDERQESAQFMMDEIKHICTTMPKREPGGKEEGEKIACQYMADQMKDYGCERADLESYKINPGSFYGWIYFVVGGAVLALICSFFLPLLGLIIALAGVFVMVMQFILYFKFIDKLFPEKTGYNVTAIKKCTGEVKGRVFFNGHPDATWNWPMNEKFGGKVHISQYIVSIIGALYIIGICIAGMVVNGVGFAVVAPSGATLPLFIAAMVSLVFAPWFYLVCNMWDSKTVVDGANDNLSGCYMGIAILKAMKDNGIELENTEVGVILSGCEEIGLRGAKAWCEAHKGEFDDVPTWIYSFDTIHDPKFLMVNYRDLNATVKADKEVSDSFVNAAKELGIPCNTGMVPPMGGATDSAAFAQAGFRATGVTGLDHVLERYYHTIYDTADNLNKDGLANCYGIAVKCLENFDNNISK